MLVQPIKFLLSDDRAQLTDFTYENLVDSGNHMMVVSAIVMSLAIIVGYTHDHVFPQMWVQIPTHMSLIVFAGLLKLGYVFRCLGRYGLGERSI